MTAITGGGGLTQQLYGKLFERLNTDGDDALSRAEVGAAGGVSAKDAEAAFKALDADGDGRVVRAEMAPSDRFAVDTINTMLVAQEAVTPENDRKIVAHLFARADLDGDGALSAEEMDAERAVRRSASVDAGYSPNQLFLARDLDGDGLLRPDEVLVGHRVKLKLGGDPIRVDPAQAAIRPVSIHGDAGQIAPGEPDPFERRQKLLDRFESKTPPPDAPSADATPAGGFRHSTRERDEMKEGAAAEKTAEPISDALVARLMRNILQSWNAAPTSVDTSA